MEWLSDTCKAIAAVAAAFSVPTLIQIMPVKINPWTWLGDKVRKTLFADLTVRIDALQTSMDEHIAKDAERDAKNCRLRILRFNDEIIQGKYHTREHFNEILDDITLYEHYCESHPAYENSKAVLAVENVKRIYKKCTEENSFL